MTRLVLASNNKRKIAELRALLAQTVPGGADIASLSEVGYTDEIEENGSSFEENSLIKAAVAASLGYIGIADDSGLTVDALDGAPGIYSARYSTDAEVGKTGDRDAANRAKLLRELDGVCAEQRGAAFVCVISVVLPEGCDIVIPTEYRADAKYAEAVGLSPERCMTVRGECRGVITEREAGEGGFGYDSLFYSPELSKTFAEADSGEKGAVSHRGRALRELSVRLGRLAKSERI